jgi:predicted SAM-dependent methyltransferase
MAARPISIVSEALRLNLGCSDAHVKGWLNVDLCPPADQIADLSQRWPWNDCSVGEVKAWDLFEHLPSKIHTMNECHRVFSGGSYEILREGINK